MGKLDILLRLIQNNATLRQIQDFLQDRGLPSSAQSWETMMEARVMPAVEKGQLKEPDLIRFLAEVEEFGTQHIFLYRRKGTGLSLPDDRALRIWLHDLDNESVLTAPRVLEFPQKPTIAEVKRDQAGERPSVSVKVIETRIVTTLVGEEERANDRFVRLYQRERVRAVNVARLHGDGLLEIRIYSHKSRGHDYKADRDSLWSLLAGILDPGSFAVYPIARAKQALWEKRNSLRSRIRFSNSEIRNDQGTLIACNTGNPQRTLWDDASAEAGLSAFMKTGDAHCETHNVWWLKQAGLPSREVHVLISGEVNEFAITQQCARNDYEHILADIRRLNK